LDPHAAPPFETAASHQHATEGANVNPDRPGSAYGYVNIGGWVGGQAEYVLVPYADWNLLKSRTRTRRWRRSSI